VVERVEGVDQTGAPITTAVTIERALGFTRPLVAAKETNSLRKQNFLISAWAWKGKAATAQWLWLWSMQALTHTTIN
jgi:hypothetical protein